MTIYDGKTQERVEPGTEKSSSLDINKAFMEVGTIFPQIYDRRIALPAVVFQQGMGDAAIKGVTTDERHLT